MKVDKAQPGARIEPRTGGSTVTKRIAEASPRLKARIAGAFYLLTILTGALSLAFVGPKLVVYANAAILISTSCYVVVTLLFYNMFKPVSRRLSLLAAFF